MNRKVIVLSTIAALYLLRRPKRVSEEEDVDYDQWASDLGCSSSELKLKLKIKAYARVDQFIIHEDEWNKDVSDLNELNLERHGAPLTFTVNRDFLMEIANNCRVKFNDFLSREDIQDEIYIPHDNRVETFDVSKKNQFATPSREHPLLKGIGYLKDQTVKNAGKLNHIDRFNGRLLDGGNCIGDHQFIMMGRVVGNDAVDMASLIKNTQLALSFRDDDMVIIPSFYKMQEAILTMQSKPQMARENKDLQIPEYFQRGLSGDLYTSKEWAQKDMDVWNRRLYSKWWELTSFFDANDSSKKVDWNYFDIGSMRALHKKYLLQDPEPIEVLQQARIMTSVKAVTAQVFNQEDCDANGVRLKRDGSRGDLVGDYYHVVPICTSKGLLDNFYVVLLNQKSTAPKFTPFIESGMDSSIYKPNLTTNDKYNLGLVGELSLTEIKVPHPHYDGQYISKYHYQGTSFQNYSYKSIVGRFGDPSIIDRPNYSGSLNGKKWRRWTMDLNILPREFYEGVKYRLHPKITNMITESEIRNVLITPSTRDRTLLGRLFYTGGLDDIINWGGTNEAYEEEAAWYPT